MPFFETLTSVIIVSLISLVGIFTISINEQRLRRSLFFLVALATGALFGDAFLHLIPEAIEEIGNIEQVAIAILGGILLFFLLETVLQWNHKHHHHCEGDHCPPTPNPLGVLIVVSDGVHNFIDGVIIAASFLVSPELGIASTIAILLHEIPQEIGDFGILLHAGYSKIQALLVNFLSASVAIVGALVTLFFSTLATELLPWILAFSGGVFIYIAAADLVPELHKRVRLRAVIIELCGILIGIGFMYLLLFLE